MFFVEIGWHISPITTHDLVFFRHSTKMKVSGGEFSDFHIVAFSIHIFVRIALHAIPEIQASLPTA